MRTPRKYVVALAFLVLCFTYSFGQGYDPSFTYGSYPFQTSLQDSESVNLATGNLHFQIPVVRLPGRNGHDFVYSLSYNSQIWWGFIFTDPQGNLHQQWASNAAWSNSIPYYRNDSSVSPPGLPNIRCTGNYRVYLPDGRTIYFGLYTSYADYTYGWQNPLPAPQYNVYSGSQTTPRDSNGDYVEGGPGGVAYISLSPSMYVILENGERISFPPSVTCSPLSAQT